MSRAEQQADVVETGAGRVLSDLRRAQGCTLSEVARRTGVSISTLSKIENNQTQPAYSVLVRLAEGLQVDFGALIGGAPVRSANGARAVTRDGAGRFYSNEMGNYEALATELAGKVFEPMIVEIPADGRVPGTVRSAHYGDEFIYVIEGEVTFEMEPYAPLILEQGDSVYFDGSSSHGFAARKNAPARLLSICHTPRGGSRFSDTN